MAVPAAQGRLALPQRAVMDSIQCTMLQLDLAHLSILQRAGSPVVMELDSFWVEVKHHLGCQDCTPESTLSRD